MKVEGVFSALRTTLSGLSAQMKRLEVISKNIANAKSLPDENNNVYKRKAVVESSRRTPISGRFGDHMTMSLKRSSGKHIIKSGNSGNSTLRETDTKSELKIVEVGGEKLVHDPSNPQADENGYVKMPDINIVEEMVDMISASRAFEANITVMNAAKQMAKKTLEI